MLDWYDVVNQCDGGSLVTRNRKSSAIDIKKRESSNMLTASTSGFRCLGVICLDSSEKRTNQHAITWKICMAVNHFEKVHWIHIGIHFGWSPPPASSPQCARYPSRRMFLGVLCALETIVNRKERRPSQSTAERIPEMERENPRKSHRAADEGGSFCYDIIRG